MIYAFGDHELDTTLYEPRYVGKPCKLEPRVFNVLLYLIQHRTHVVTRDELLDMLWPGLCNGVALLNTCIMEARKAVGDSGQIQQVIKTVHGRGYRFIAPTTEQYGEEPVQKTPEMLPVQKDLWDAFQDVLPGEQTVGTIVCGTLVQEDLGTRGVGDESGPRLRRTFFAHAQEQAQHYAGTLSFFGADGMLMLFTQKAHAQRAVRAALRLQRQIEDVVITHDAQPASAGTMRLGMHTGPLVVPCVTDPPWWTSFTTAESTTIAVWLHNLARPATMLTSNVTLSCICEMVQWAEHGAIRIPGLPDPLMAYRIWTPLADITSAEGALQIKSR